MPKPRPPSLRPLLPSSHQLHEDLLEASGKAPLGKVHDLLAAGANPLWQGDHGSYCSISRSAALGRLAPLCALIDAALALGSASQKELQLVLLEAALGAIEHGHLNCLKAILNRLPIPSDIAKPSAWASLLIDAAACHARPTILSFLIKTLPRPWAPFPAAKQHPLSCCARFGELACVQMLLAAKNPDGHLSCSQAALSDALIACSAKHSSVPSRMPIALALLQAGANPKHARDSDGWTPLMAALFRGDLGLAELLVPLSDLSAVSSRGSTLLDLAKASDNSACGDFFELLLLARKERSILAESSAPAKAPLRRSARI